VALLDSPLNRILFIGVPAAAIGIGVTILTGGLLGVPALIALGGGLFGGGAAAAAATAVGAVASGLASYFISRKLDGLPLTVKGALVNVGFTLGMTYAGLGTLWGMGALVAPAAMDAAEAGIKVWPPIGEMVPHLAQGAGGIGGAAKLQEDDDEQLRDIELRRLEHSVDDVDSASPEEISHRLPPPPAKSGGLTGALGALDR
jgi:hypothetical protein